MSGVNTLTVYVDSIADIMTSFDAMRIRRSTSQSGPWTEITAVAAAAAVLQGSVAGPFALATKILQFKLDSLPQTNITFTGTDPLTVDQAAAQINAVHAGIASNVSNKLKLTSLLTGTQSKLEIVGGSAATVLGFVNGQRDIGEEAYINLVPGTSIYNFYDRDADGAGGQKFYYEAAYYNTTTFLTSEWSEPFEAEPGTAISADKLSLGSIDLVDVEGVSTPDQEITFVPMWEPLTVESKQVAMVRKAVTITTNNSGHAEISLVRGLKVKVIFAGTSFIREIQVPDAPTFDLVALMAAAPDPFNPQFPNYPAAPRRTL